MSESRFEDEDPILPVRITHSCEQMWDGNSLEEEYNYLDYEFVTEAHEYRARAYLDTIDTVSIFGPNRRDSGRPVPRAEIDQRVMAYLRRRYSKLQRLGSSGYERIK